MIKTYEELIRLQSFEERFEYLKTGQFVGDPTFGVMRYLNQKFYHSKEWREFKDSIILRDDACELGIEGLPISGRLIVHHLNPITLETMQDLNVVLNPSNVICCSDFIHKRIHYGDFEPAMILRGERTPNDTKLW